MLPPTPCPHPLCAHNLLCHLRTVPSAYPSRYPPGAMGVLNGRHRILTDVNLHHSKEAVARDTPLHPGTHRTKSRNEHLP